jgi:hypothetical protein
MATRKAPQSKKKTTKKSSKASKARTSGAVPPYGDPIRGAIARGNVQEMKNIAANTRKWLADVQSALAQLEGAIKKSGS